MTKEQAEVALEKMTEWSRSRANEGDDSFDEGDHRKTARIEGQAEGAAHAARILAETLAESKKGSDEKSQRTILLPGETVRSWSSPRSATREIPEAGPGLWSMIRVTAHNEGHDVYSVVVVPRMCL